MRRVSLVFGCALSTVAVMAAGMMPQATAQESQQDVLKVIIERAREREAFYDNYEWRYSALYSDKDGALITRNKGNWVRSGGRFRWDEEMRGGNGSAGAFIRRMAADGKIDRSLQIWGGGETRGHIMKPHWSTWDGACHFEVGVGARPGGWPAPLSEMLEGNLGAVAAKYDMELDLDARELRVALMGEAQIDGRVCSVVDFIGRYADAEGHWGSETVTRYYFAPDINYACVGRDTGSYKDSQFVRYGGIRSSDFREVKPGLFVPFSMTVEYQPGGQILQVKTESIESGKTFDDSVFALGFPPGTHMVDDILGEEYVVGAAGSQEELGALLDRLSSTDEQPADAGAQEAGSTGEMAATAAQPPREESPAKEESGARAWIAAIAGLAAVIAAGVLLRRRRAVA